MRFARSLLSGVFFLGYGLLAVAFAPLLVLPVWTERGFRRLIRFFYRVFVWCARWTGLFTVACEGGRLHGAGRLVVMNHVSLIDIVVLLAHLPDATAIAKAAVRRNPFLGLTARRMFLINDADPSALMAEARRLLAAGVCVVVFPQGTRGGRKLHRGAARLALATGADILPVRIAYDPPVLAKGQPWWDVGPRTIRITLAPQPVIRPVGPNDHATAVRLTARLGTALGLSSPRNGESKQ